MPTAVAGIRREHVEAFIAAELVRTAVVRCDPLPVAPAALQMAG